MTFDRPGAVNAHTHLYSGLVPFGMPAPEPAPRDFPEILQRLWWLLDRALDAEALRASARWAVAQALLHGTTTLIDHHESPGFIAGSLDVLADACEELGCRAVVTYGATERNFGRDEAREGLAECGRFVKTNTRRLVRGAVGLHASFTVSDETIREAGALCRTLGVPLHMHVAEDLSDVQDAKTRGFVGPLERLVALDALPEGSVLAHGVHLSASQVKLATDRGAWFVQNPRSNANNRVGYSRTFRNALRVALGTDGFTSDMEAEVALVAEQAAQTGDAPAAGRARLDRGLELVEHFFGEGALGGDRVCGETVDGRRTVKDVDVNGRLVVRGGRLVNGDLEMIEADARREAARLWRRMDELRPQAGSRGS